MNKRRIIIAVITLCVVVGVMPILFTDRTTVQLPIACQSQHPLYPTGCESVTAVMALQYVGENITTEAFIDEHLPKSDRFYYKNGQLIGPNPHQYFVGDPRKKNSYGCFAPVIEKALQHYFGSSDRIINTTGTAISTLCQQYIDNGLPVILWAGIRMEPIKEGSQWQLENGEQFTWPSGEHCVLLVGYNRTHYLVNDPYAGKTTAYEKAVVESRYREMDKQSLVITR